MSGPNRHFIPQLILRQFGDATTGRPGRPEETWVYRRGAAPVRSQISLTASDYNFYSDPVDEAITSRETPLARRIQNLLALSPGAEAPGEIAENIINLLAPRTAHLRSTFGHGIQIAIEGLRQQFSDPAAVRRVVGLDESEPNDRFRDRIWSELARLPQWQLLQLPEHVLERVGYRLVQELFDDLYAQSGPVAHEFLSELMGHTPAMMRDVHNNAIGTLLQTPRSRRGLRAYSWMVQEGPPEGLLLPDCVVIGVMRDGTPYPFMHGNENEAQYVLMPLSGERVLIGSAVSAPPFEVGAFNDMAVECSHDFFAARTDVFASLSTRIGRHSVTIIEEAARGAVIEVGGAPTEISQAGLAETEGSSEVASAAVGGASEHISFPLIFEEAFTQEQRQAIGADIQSLVGHLAEVVSVRRLDGLEFSRDAYGPEESTRGVESEEATPINTEVEFLSRLLFDHDGVVKCRIALPARVGYMLLSEDFDARRHAFFVVAFALSGASFFEALVGRLGLLGEDPMGNQLDTYLVKLLYRGIEEYCAARTVHSLWDSEGAARRDRDTFAAEFSAARQRILRARWEYRFHGNLDAFLGAIWPEVNGIFRGLGRLLGHSEALSRQVLREGEELRRVFDDCQLSRWLPRFQRDLNEFWSRMGSWSVDDLRLLNRYVERLLWSFGLFPWEMADGRIYFDIPRILDASNPFPPPNQE